MIRSVLFILSLLALNNVMAQPVRPTIGLVLSGGGARGAAHIGVIEALEEMHVPIDLIVGTSMGAVIGGLYASGVPIEKIKYDLCDLNWETLFKNDIKRSDLYFRRKLDDQIFVSKNFIGMTNGSLHLSFGLTNGQNLYEIFKTYTIQHEPLPSFAHLPIPFKAVSTDLLTGETIALECGDLAMALLASMAVPGIVSPVPFNEHLLVDGGVSDNLPIEIAKQMGADILIVVNVSTPLLTQSQIHDLTSVLSQISTLLTNNNIQESEQLLTRSDIYIQPALDGIVTANFDKFSDAILPGREAAYAHVSTLRALSQPHYMPPSSLPYMTRPIPIDNILITTNHGFCRKTYADFLQFDSNLVCEQDINARIRKLYGLNIFDKIYYGMETDLESSSLNVKPKLKPKRSFLFQESLLMHSDFHSDHTFSFVLGVTDPHINRYLGEWRVVGALGSNVGLVGEYYQPLDPSLAWFINPYIYFNRTPIELFYNFSEIGEFVNNSYIAELRLGRNFSNWARMYGYFETNYESYEPVVNQYVTLPTFERQNQVGLTFEWDTLDNLYFPHHGSKGEVTLSKTRAYFSEDPHFNQFTGKSMSACSTGKHSLVLATRYDTTFAGEANFISQFFLGGLFQLTGLQNYELQGSKAALATALYIYELKKIHFIPNRPFPVYVGGSFEVGNVWGANNNIPNHHHPIYSNSFFIGSDTLFGPIYLGAGSTYNGKKAVHLLIGPFF